MRARWAVALTAVLTAVAVTAGGAAWATDPVQLGSGRILDDVDVLSPSDEAQAVTGSAADDELVDPRYEDLWVSGEESAPTVREVDLDQLFTGGEEGDDASVDIPDLASIEPDFDEDRPDTAT